MSIQAQTPDGVIHQFPDGTPDAAVDRAVKDYLSQSAAKAPASANENAWQKGARLTVEAYKGADQAYRADMAKAGQPGSNIIDKAKPVLDAFAAATSPIKGFADAAFGDKPVALPFGINSKGLTPGDMVTMAVPLAGEMGAARAVARTAEAAGVTTRTMDNALQASRGASSNAANATAARPPNAMQETVARFDKAGVRPTMAATGEGNAHVAKGISENPLAGIKVRSNLQASLDDTAKAVDRSAQGYGQPASKGAAGEAVQEGVQDFSKRFSNRADALYTPIFDKIDAAHSAAAQKAQQEFGLAKAQTADEFENSKAAAQLDYRNRLAQAAHGDTEAEIAAKAAANLKGARTANMSAAAPDVPAQKYVWPSEAPPAPAMPQKSAVIQPDATKGVLAKINARGDSPALKGLFSTPQVQRLTEAVGDPASLSFRDLRDARTWVRNAQHDDALRQGVSQSDLQRLEGALTQDINTNAATIAGPKAARQLQQADAFYRLGSQRIQGALQKFVGKSDDMAGENTFDRIGRMAGDKGGADTARLTALKKSLQPNEWGDVAATHLARMGQAPDGTFSVQRFVTGFDNLSPQGKDLLYGKGEQRDALENLAAVARKQQKVEQAANRSNTAVNAQAIGTVAGLVTPHTAIPTALGLVGAGLTGEVLTNPAAVRFLARLGQAKSPAEVSAQVRVIDAASKRNAALLPLAQAARSIRFPSAAPAAATTSQAQAKE